MIDMQVYQVKKAIAKESGLTKQRYICQNNTGLKHNCITIKTTKAWHLLFHYQTHMGLHIYAQHQNFMGPSNLPYHYENLVVLKTYCSNINIG